MSFNHVQKALMAAHGRLNRDSTTLPATLRRHATDKEKFLPLNTHGYVIGSLHVDAENAPNIAWVRIQENKQIELVPLHSLAVVDGCGGAFDIHLAEPQWLPESPDDEQDGKDCIEHDREGYYDTRRGTRKDVDVGKLVYGETWAKRVDAFAQMLEDSLSIDPRWSGIFGGYLCERTDEPYGNGGILEFYAQTVAGYSPPQPVRWVSN